MLSLGEAAELKEMRQKIAYLENKKYCTEIIGPYVRNPEGICRYCPSNNSWKIRIPKELQRDGKTAIWASTVFDAWEKCAEWLKGQIQTPAGLFEVLMDERDQDSDISPDSKRQYRNYWVQYYSSWECAEWPIGEIGAPNIKALWKSFTAGRKMTRQRFLNVAAVLRAVFDLACDQGLISVNWARITSTRDLKWAEPKENDTYYTDKDRSALLSEIDRRIQSGTANGYDLAIGLQFCADLRFGEIGALQWRDWDEDDSTIYVRSSLKKQRGEDGLVHLVDSGTTKTGSKGRRTLDLSDRGQQYIRLAQALLRAPGYEDYIFVNTSGTHIRTNQYNRHLKSLCTKVGIPYCSSHKIRKWNITAQAAAGLDPITIQQNSGHTSLGTTYGYIISRNNRVDRSTLNQIYS